MSLKDRISAVINNSEAVSSGDQLSLRTQILKEKFTHSLSQIKASDFPSLLLGKVIEIPSNATIVEAVTILSQNSILSAPVRNVKAPENVAWQDQYLGIIDFSGIVLWVLKEAEVMATAITASAAGAGGLAGGVSGAIGAVALGIASLGWLTGIAAGAAAAGALAAGIAAGSSAGRSGPSAVEALGDDFFKLLNESELYQKTKISDVSALYIQSPIQPILTSNSLLTLFRLLSHFDIKRVPIFDHSTGLAVNYVTQSSVVQNLYECQGLEWFDLLSEQSLNQLGLPLMSASEIITVQINTPVIDAFQVMHVNRIGGLPILDNGRLVGNLSHRDILFLLSTPELFDHGREPSVGVLMEKAKLFVKKNDDVVIQPLMSPPITASSDQSLKEVMAMFVNHRIHRVYITNSEMHVTGVVTPRDIISCFVKLEGVNLTS